MGITEIIVLVASVVYFVAGLQLLRWSTTKVRIARNELADQQLNSLIHDIVRDLDQRIVCMKRNEAGKLSKHDQEALKRGALSDVERRYGTKGKIKRQLSLRSKKAVDEAVLAKIEAKVRELKLESK